MDAFIGSWKLVKMENFSEYLKALGVMDEVISVAQVIRPVVTYSKDDDFVVVSTKSTVHTTEVWFRLGEEYFEETRDGRKTTNVVTLEGGKLLQVQKWDDKQTTFVREIKNKNKIMTLTFGDVVATLTYEKV